MAADAPVRVVFDHGIDRASVAGRFHIDPPLLDRTRQPCLTASAFSAGDGAPCRITWRADYSGFALEHPGALFKPDTTYHLSLDAGVTDADGSVNGLDHHWTITAASAPQVRSLVPGDGATGVAVDAPLSVTFTVPMAAQTTLGAILLEPAVPGTRVVQNSRDRSRFVILPGRLLETAARYTLRVSAGATDDHSQALERSVAATFTTGGLGGSGHALVLARRAGEAPTEVLLTARAPVQGGEPAAAATILEAPRGAAGSATPTVSYLAAAVAADGRHLAVVVRDETTADQPFSLHVVALPSGDVTAVASEPHDLSWSPDGQLLAFGDRAGIQLYEPATGRVTTLPPGDPLDDSPAWSADGAVLALPVRAHDGSEHVDLADPALGIRYAAPLLTGRLSSPALSRDGTLLAVRREGGDPGCWLVGLRTTDAAARLLNPDITPVAWIDAGTLLGVDRPPDGDSGLVRVTVADGDVDRLTGGPAASDLSTVASDPGGRILGYLLDDAQGVVQAYTENTDGTNPSPLTTFSRQSGYEAFSVSFGG